MALNVNRWLQYAKARIDSAVGAGHESLDRLEAQQEAERADKPWLGSDSTAPTFDEARARIEWEADQQAKTADRLRRGDQTGAGAGLPGAGTEGNPVDAPLRRKTDIDPKGSATSGDPTPDAGPPPRSPQQIAEDAELETARLELEERQRTSAERLDEIRRELGIDDTPAP